jgi:glycerol-3-phosphate dehydrogenase
MGPAQSSVAHAPVPHAAVGGIVPPLEADLLVVGGGINGAGIARDAAGRGLRVVLCEQGDLAQGTSSRSSRLIHGGLRYLEYGEWRLVREALQEREILLAAAPHLVRPLCFVLPHVQGMRPAWMLRLGLFLYDHLARRRRLPASRAIALDQAPEGAAVRPHLRRAFVYADCRTDDARLVVLNAVGAAERGARVLLHTEFVDAIPEAGAWRARLRAARTGATSTLRVRAIVNAAGPWVEAVAPRIGGVARQRHARLVKGSHLVVRRFWQGEHAFLLQNTDRRVVFVTPYEDDFAMIGTTDIPYASDPGCVRIGEQEARYLCDAVNRQLRCTLTPADAVYTFSGVRCLVDDARDNPSAVTRDYVLELAAGAGHGPVLTVLGGKITTYRRLAEHAVDLLAPHLPASGPRWTAAVPLPGGDLAGEDVGVAQQRFLAAAHFLPSAHARALFDRHGRIATAIVGDVAGLSDMGIHFGAGLYERELRYLVDREWAASVEDVLWRRTKLGLRLDAAQVERLREWLAGRDPTVAQTPASHPAPLAGAPDATKA